MGFYEVSKSKSFRVGNIVSYKEKWEGPALFNPQWSTLLASINLRQSSGNASNHSLHLRFLGWLKIAPAVVIYNFHSNNMRRGGSGCPSFVMDSYAYPQRLEASFIGRQVHQHRGTKKRLAKHFSSYQGRHIGLNGFCFISLQCPLTQLFPQCRRIFSHVPNFQ